MHAIRLAMLTWDIKVASGLGLHPSLAVCLLAPLTLALVECIEPCLQRVREHPGSHYLALSCGSKRCGVGFVRRNSFFHLIQADPEL